MCPSALRTRRPPARAGVFLSSRLRHDRDIGPARAAVHNVAMQKLTKSDVAWAQQLTAEQYRVLRQKGTERAFSGVYWDEHRPGVYRCAGCGNELFSSDTKYDSRLGLAELLRAGRARRRGGGDGPRLPHDPDGGHVQRSAGGTSATCSPTVRGRRACATASTPRRSPWSPGHRQRTRRSVLAGARFRGELHESAEGVREAHLERRVRAHP